jgi:Mn-dependent DtxR family transcriptional regulator
MDEDDAELDACKVEHLFSKEMRERLVRFLRFLLSQDTEAASFLDAFREATRAHVLECKDGDVEACLLCEDVCFVEPVALED